MKNVRLTSDDYGYLWCLIKNEIHSLKGGSETESVKMSYLKELNKKLYEHCRVALEEENGDDDDE